MLNLINKKLQVLQKVQDLITINQLLLFLLKRLPLRKREVVIRCLRCNRIYMEIKQLGRLCTSFKLRMQMKQL